ncbi:HlyD family secretion protein [Coleofasciculus sp.]|uniref:HlyD family secretion protein n=1 Tax=Coleofasciculus sp. TaxID=3100458 RepID=UPI0039F9DACF
MTQTLSPREEQEQKAPESGKFAKPKGKLSPRLLIPAGLLIAGVAAATWYFLTPSPTDETLQLSGRIEGYETDIGAKVPGKVESVAVREGNNVSAGQTIVRLDDDEIQAQLRQAKARVEATQQQERQARLQIDVLMSRLQEATLNLQQTQQNASGRISQANASVATAEAQLSQAIAQLQQAQAELTLAKTDRDRFTQLLRGGVISQQQFDQAQTKVNTLQSAVAAQQAVVEANRRQVNAAQGELEQAQTSRLNPAIAQAQINALNKQLDQARAQLAAAESDIKQAQAAQDAIAAKINDLTLTSPIQGTVLTRTVEPGEVIAAGQHLITVLDLDEVYLRGYIPEGDIGKVRVGQKAKVYLDSFPEQPLSATVTEIDTQASFTPENIYFKEDRVKQVFGVKIRIDNPEGFAKPGMPADAEILLEEEVHS